MVRVAKSLGCVCFLLQGATGVVVQVPDTNPDAQVTDWEVQLNRIFKRPGESDWNNPDNKKIRDDMFGKLKEQYMNRAPTQRELQNLPREIARLGQETEELRSKKAELARKIREADDARAAAPSRADKRDKLQKVEGLRTELNKVTDEMSKLVERVHKKEEQYHEHNSKERRAAEELDRQRWAEHAEDMEIERKKEAEWRAANKINPERRREKAAENRRLAEADRAHRNMKAKFDREKDAREKEDREEFAAYMAEKDSARNAERVARSWAERRVKEHSFEDRQESKKNLNRLDAEQRELRQIRRKQGTRAEADVKETELRHVFFEDMMGEVGVSDMVGMLQALRTACADKLFMGNVSSAQASVQNLAATYFLHIKSRSDDFVQKVAHASHAELMEELASVLMESAGLLSAHREDVSEIVRSIERVGPPSLAKKSAGFIKTIAPAMHPLAVNVSLLKVDGASQEAQCSQVAGIMESFAHYSDLTNTKNSIMATEKMLPVFSNIMPDLTPELSLFVKSFMNASYSETQALEDASNEVLSKVGPIVMRKLHCTWKSAAGKGASAFGLVATVVALAVTRLATAL